MSTAATPSPAPATSTSTAAPADAGDPLGSNPDHIGPGPIAFTFFIVLLVAAALLVWSMSRRIRKVDFDEGPTSAAPDAGDDPPGPPAPARR